MNQNAQEQNAPDNRVVFGIAWPLAVKAVMLHSVLVIDAFLVSSQGENALASMGLASAIAGMLLAFLFAFSNATQVRIAQAFGSGDLQRLKSSVVAGLVVNLTVSGIGMVVIWAFAKPIIWSLAHTPEIAVDALNYLFVLFFLFAGEAISQCIGSYFNGCGKTRIPLYSHVLSLPVNVGVSIVLIHGHFGLPELGLTGAAVGSAVAATIRAIFLSAMFRSNDFTVLQVPGWQTGSFRGTLQRHLAFSLPIGATFVSAGISTQVCMLLYAKLSVNEFAAMTVILPWIQVVGTMGMAWAQSTGIVVAQMLGAREDSATLDNFLGHAWRGVFVPAAFIASVYLTVCLFAGAIYTGLQVETTDALLGFIPILVLLPFPKCSNAICGNTLRAAGDTVYVMNIFVGSQWLFKVPLTAALILFFDVSVTWIIAILLFEEFVKFPAFHLRIFTGKWKSSLAALD